MTVQSNYASDFEKGDFENVATLDFFESEIGRAHV